MKPEIHFANVGSHRAGWELILANIYQALRANVERHITETGEGVQSSIEALSLAITACRGFRDRNYACPAMVRFKDGNIELIPPAEHTAGVKKIVITNDDIKVID